MPKLQRSWMNWSLSYITGDVIRFGQRSEINSQNMDVDIRIAGADCSTMFNHGCAQFIHGCLPESPRAERRVILEWVYGDHQRQGFNPMKLWKWMCLKKGKKLPKVAFEYKEKGDKPSTLGVTFRTNPSVFGGAQGICKTSSFARPALFDHRRGYPYHIPLQQLVRKYSKVNNPNQLTHQHVT